jgi:hypothetical protein
MSQVSAVRRVRLDPVSPGNTGVYALVIAGRGGEFGGVRRRSFDKCLTREPPQVRFRVDPSGSAGERSLDVGDAAPQPLPVEVLEAEMAVELRRILVDRVDDNGARAELAPATHAAP